MKHTNEPLPKIEPYVTAKGGVVILNGPFPLDQAERIKVLCEAAPALLEACKTMLEAWDCRTPEAGIVAIQKAIAQVESEVGE